MRKIQIIAVLLLLLFAPALTSAFQNEPDSFSNSRMFTAYNIYKWPQRNMICLNFNGSLYKIPAGTEVKGVKVVNSIRDPDYSGIEFIEFTTVEDNKTFQIKFIERYHPGKTINDLKGIMFTDKTFDELIQGLSEREIDAIKQGIVIKGMRKQAVFITLGPP